MCIIRKGEKCDPYIDGCEKGTMCLPENLQDIDGVNICIEFSENDWKLIKNISRHEKSLLILLDKILNYFC